MNVCMFIGNLTRDPELKSLRDDKKVVTFGIAVNRRYKGRDGEAKKETTFINLEAWGKTAEVIAKYFEKGDPIVITRATFRLDTWKKDGEKRSRPVFRVEDFAWPPFNSPSSDNVNSEAEPQEEPNEETIPF
jgi:single-strand DNA-binding protein